MAPKNAGPVLMEVDQEAQEGGFEEACVCILLVLQLAAMLPVLHAIAWSTLGLQLWK